VKDSSQYARAELGSVIMSIAHVVKKKDVFDHLLPLYLQLLKDSHSEVRLNIISKLDMLNQVITISLYRSYHLQLKLIIHIML
jgi:serine/threonine-protein phosphatase 2A regulatory subunit A